MNQLADAPTLGSTSRFTLDGSPELEQQLGQLCNSVLQGLRGAVPPLRLKGVLLGGGYGRGEGGVLRNREMHRPYNDLEFYIFISGPLWLSRRQYDRKVRQLAHQISATAGIEIELKIISSAKLRLSPPSMFYYDLLSRHRWLQGHASLLDGCEHHLRPGIIPHSEAIRLLMNRFSGLLYARQKLNRQSLNAEDADFIGRNIAKCQLAMGDAVLTMHGLYHWSCRERHRRLKLLPPETPWLELLWEHHATGVEFKLHPRQALASHPLLEELFAPVAKLGRQVWLWVESRRLRTSFESVAHYAQSDIDKCPETPPWRNLLVNLKVFGPRGFPTDRTLRHPRERLLNALPLLLWESIEDPAQLRQLQEQLRTPAESFGELVEAYRSLWLQCS